MKKQLIELFCGGSLAAAITIIAHAMPLTPAGGPVQTAGVGYAAVIPREGIGQLAVNGPSWELSKKADAGRQPSQESAKGWTMVSISFAQVRQSPPANSAGPVSIAPTVASARFRF